MISRRTLVTSGIAIAALGAVGYGLWPNMQEYNEAVEAQRRLLEADPELADFIRMATLAANSHNTQPWRFRIADNAVSVLPDFTRRTEIVDPDDHHLFISLGCAAENLVIAAQAHGRSAEVSMAEENDPGLTIQLASGAANAAPLYDAIPHRQSTRSIYDGQPISAEELALLKRATEEAGVEVLFFTEPSQREHILEFVIAGNSAQIDNPAFVEELREWIRFSPDAALARGDGLFSACSGNPVLPDWMGKRLFNAVFKKETENDKYRDQIRSSAGVAVFVADTPGPDGWMKVGQSFERFALQATALGIRNAHINQPIEVPSIRPEFASWIGMPNARPDLIVRFGKAPPLPQSLRRPVAEVIV